MGQQIKVFEKNIIDIDAENIVITSTDLVAEDNGQDTVNFLRNRKNDSAWMTTGSTDAALTTLVVDWMDGRDVDSIVLIRHNFKSYTIKYWDGNSWEDFSTPIDVTDSQMIGDDDTVVHDFDKLEIQRIQIVVRETKIPNHDKRLFQLLVTEKIGQGQLNGWPIIASPVVSANKKVTKMLSGKVSVTDSLGFFTFTLKVDSWRDENDLSMVESVLFKRRGVLMWLCGGDEEQFSTKRIGYRKEDFYLVRPVTEYSPEWRQGFYWSGLGIDITFTEAID